MGKLRKRLRRTHQQEITDIRKSLELGQAISQLEGENCLLPKG